MNKPKVIIIGGGFGGLTAAQQLKHADIDLKIIDRNNYHLFQPLLYQVATAALSPGDIASPIRGILKGHENTQVVLGDVKEIDRANKRVILDNEEFEYDYLIVATGSTHSYFGNEKWEKYAPGLKTIKDALTIRERILLSFEKAERDADKENIDKYMTFVVVGGGPTGVEMAGAIAEIAKKKMLRNFKKIDPAKTKVILAEGMDRVLSAYAPTLSEEARKALENMGVNVWLNKMVKEVREEGVMIEDEFIETPNVIWAAGNSASPLLNSLNTEQDKGGRVHVDNDCSLKDDENVFVIGDAAHFIQDGEPLPALAPVALQQGKYVSKIISKKTPKSERKPFEYWDKGTMATIGKAKAIAQIGKLKISGFVAWLMWSFVHIMYLIGFRNRYKVMAEWIWFYLSNRPGIRLITGKTNL